MFEAEVLCRKGSKTDGGTLKRPYDMNKLKVLKFFYIRLKTITVSFEGLELGKLSLSCSTSENRKYVHCFRNK